MSVSLLVGGNAVSLLFGVATTLAIFYFRAFPHDRLFFKIAVGLSWVGLLVQSIGITINEAIIFLGDPPSNTVR